MKLSKLKIAKERQGISSDYPLKSYTGLIEIRTSEVDDLVQVKQESYPPSSYGEGYLNVAGADKQLFKQDTKSFSRNFSQLEFALLKIFKSQSSNIGDELTQELMIVEDFENQLGSNGIKTSNHRDSRGSHHLDCPLDRSTPKIASIYDIAVPMNSFDYDGCANEAKSWSLWSCFHRN